MKKTKSKTKICLSLLIAMAFILPSAAVFGDTSTDESTEIIDASDFKKTPNKTQNLAIETIDYRSTDPIASLDWVPGSGWPIEVDSINIGSPIASGEYDIEATFCRPDFSMGAPPVLAGSGMMTDVYISSDCDTVTIEFQSMGPIYMIWVYTQGGNNFDHMSPEASGVGTPIVTFVIDRDDLRVGDCNEKGFWIDWEILDLFFDIGYISTNEVKELIAYDCGPAEIKKFLEIYKEQETPEVTENIYCTDFEDPCEFYDEWATYDKSPDWGNNGAIDTWTWTDKKANSPTHSFHSTAGDTYLMNQHDILEFNMDMQGLYMGNDTDVIYDLINISWAQWMEGDSIIVNGTRLIQDGGYVQVAFTNGAAPTTWTTISEVFYTSDGWEDEYINNITVTDDYLFVRFVFFSDAAFCYEGWYIDDFCVDGIQDEFGEWEFVSDSHSHEQIMEGECIDHTFIEEQFLEEGTYKICVWLQTLDDCHYAVHGSDIFGEDMDINDAYCIIVEVEDCLDYEALGVDFDPESPAWEGDDVEICATTYNGGTIDGLDAQVQVTVQYGAEETVLDDPFDCDVDEVTIENFEDYGEMWHQSAKGVTYYDWVEGPDGVNGDDNYRSYWHFAELDDDPDNCVLINFDHEEKTSWPMSYPEWDSVIDGYPGDYGSNEWVNTPMGLIVAADRSLDVTIEFDVAWALPDVDGCGWQLAVGDDSAGRLTRFVDNFDPTTTADNDEKVSNGDGSWKHVGPIPMSSLIQSLVDGGTTGPNDEDLTLMFWMDKDHFNTDSGEDWSGMKIDNVVVKKLVVQEDPILFQETKIIDNTENHPENNFNVSEYNTTCFTWPDAGVGRYIVTQTVMGDTCDLTNNSFQTGYNVINYEQDFEDGDIEFIDNTCDGDGHWQVDDCCGGSFWVGDYETTMYGEFYDDCLYIAPYDEDEDEQNRTQAYGGLDLEFDTWYQINDTDDPGNFTGDWAIVEFSNDSGKHWYVADEWNGVSSPSPDPDGEDDWEAWSIPIDAGVDQIRFRFMSDNDTVENRGWMLDNIFIDGIIDDECEDFENFEISVKCYGNWWQTPSMYYAAVGMCCSDAFYDSWHDYLVWVYDVYFGYPAGTGDMIYYTYYHPAGTVCVDPDLTYGCYDLDKGIGMPGDFVWPCWDGTIEVYPYNIDNTFKWTFPVDGCYWGYVDGGFVSEQAPDGDDEALFEFSADGGEPETLFSPATVWGFMTAGIAAEFLGDELAIMVTQISDDVEEGAWDGITLQDWVFHGMKDNNAPTSTITMSGTYDEDYCYYTSAVNIEITAADDVSGIAAIYYELDGTQQTYSGPFTVSGNGEHTLCYWAVDNEGNVEDKKCVAPFRIDTTGPSVSINIEPGIYLFGNKLLSSEKYIFLFGGVPMTATASADGAPLKTVEFYINDVLFAEDTTSPFAAMCREKNTGGATFKVIAEDVLGETATATQVVDTYIKIL